MKNTILISVMMFLSSFCLQAQNEKSLVAMFNTAEDVLVVKDSKTASNFIVSAEKYKIDEMLETAKGFGNYLSLTSKAVENKTNEYAITLSFNHEAQLSEIHKNLMFFGFTGISIDKKEFPLEHILSLQK